MPGHDLDRFSSIVDDIYGCAFDPDGWPAALGRIAEYTGSDAVALDFMDLARDQPVGAFSHGFGPDFRRLLIERYARIWMMQSGFHLWEVGVPMHLPRFLPEDEFLAGAFYREWCRPQAQRDYVGMIAFRDSTRFVKMSNGRLAARGSYEPDEVERLRLLSRHLCRAVSISDAFGVERIRAGMFETVIDSLATGVVLLDADGRVDYANRSASEMIASSPLVRMRAGRLQISDRTQNARLHEIVRQAGEARGDAASVAEVLTIGDAAQSGFIATVMPLSTGPRRELLNSGKASIAVFLRDPVKRPLFVAEAFAEFYGLSPAEARVAAVLSQGGGLAGVCDVLGIAQTTAKTHLQRIFDKTGTSRQTDLMALMLASSG